MVSAGTGLQCVIPDFGCVFVSDGSKPLEPGNDSRCCVRRDPLSQRRLSAAEYRANVQEESDLVCLFVFFPQPSNVLHLVP